MNTSGRRRNSEKRKEKSRDAARCRRSRETEIFASLAQGLPLSDSVIHSLDKASVMRIVISYLKLNHLLSRIPDTSVSRYKDIESLCLPALAGFLLIISAEGDLVYISENVEHYLGLSQVDLMGNSVYEYSHPCDHDEIREVLAAKASSDLLCRSFFMRLKCTLTTKGRNVNLKSASYKVVHCSGHMMTRPRIKREKVKEKARSVPADRTDARVDGEQSEPQYLVAVAEPIPHPSNIEIPLDNQAFVSKHSLDMKFTYADKKIADVLGYSPEDLLGKSLYEFQHALDAGAVDRPFKSLFTKGQCQTGRYRMLARGGGYAWVVTQATLLYNHKGHKDSVVCVNFFASGIENKDEIYASHQLVEKKKSRPVSVTCSVIARLPSSHVKTELSAPRLAPPRPAPPTPVPTRPQPATSKIFAPKTEDMNKGYLMFSDDEPGLTILKDEPEDLTHLAPTPGDVCIPLDLPHLGDMFNDLLADNYCPLLSEDASSSSSQSRTSASDPFFSYRDDSNSMHSPAELDRRIAKSPGDCSLPSLCSPEHDDEPLGLMSLGTDSAGSELEEDLCRTAPYIPLDEDLPLLIPAVDLMWASSPSPSPPPVPPPRTHTSSLAELLRVAPESLRDNPTRNRTDHDWFNDTGQIKIIRNTQSSPHGGDVLRKAPPGVGPPYDRVGVKRTFLDRHDQTGVSNKRARSELLHHLMESSTSPPPPRSHSVLMNLLNRVPKENLGALAEVLQHLCVGSSVRRREKEAEQKQLGLRTLSSYLLQPDPGDAIPIPSLADLSQRDCEVNAPVERPTLLQGEELLTALDYVDSFPLAPPSASSAH